MSLKQNIIYLYFKGKHLITSKSQYQYNHGQYLYFADLNLPQVFEVHFSNKNRGESKTQIGSDKLVEIPDEYFWSGALEIYAWIYLHNGTDDGETIYEVKIPLIKRAKPTDEEPLPVQQSAIDKAIAELNNAVDITNENADKTNADKTQVATIKEEVVVLKEEIDSTASEVSQDAQSARESADASEQSAQNSAESERKALDYSDEAKSYAQSALESKDTASQKAQVATDASAEAKGYRDEAETFKNEAEQAKQNIVDYRDETKGYRDETLNLKNTVQTLKNQADETAEEIKDISDTVKEDAQSASQSASSANQSSINASQSASQAEKSANDAEESANQTEQNKTQTETFKNQSEEYKTQAGTFKSQAETFKNQAEEFKNQTETNVTHYPKIIGEYWYVWDATNGEYINTNVDANGIKGDTGRGIASIALNDDYTLTITFTDDTTYTTPSIRGQQGEKGNTGKTGESGVYIGTEEPENEDIKVWIDTDDDGTSEDLVKNIESLKKNIYKPYVVDSASGSIASFSDGADGIPLKSLVVDINPIQDLHGYDSPWIGGGGKNKIPFPYFTASGTIDGVTYTIDEDGKITATGTTERGTNFYFVRNMTLTAGTYTASVIGDIAGIVFKIYDPVNRVSLCDILPAEPRHWKTFTIENDTTVNIYLNTGQTGVTVNISAYFQLEEGTTATDYAPYENICPISGWEVANVTATNTNLRGGIDLANDLKMRLPSAVIDTEEKTISYKYNANITADMKVPQIKFKENTRYTFIFTLSNPNMTRTNLRIYYTDGTHTQFPDISAVGVKQTIVVTSSANKTVSTISRTAQGGTTKLYYDESGVFEGVLTASDFQQFGRVIPISWQTEAGTVYGGKLDVLSGKLMVDRYAIDPSQWTQYGASNGYKAYRINNVPKAFGKSNTVNKPLSNMISEFGSFSSSSMNKNIIQPPYPDYVSSVFMALEDDIEPTSVEFSYIMYEPLTIQLTPNEVNSLLGVNNIWADSGDTTCEYRADTKLYINKKIAEALASLT